MARLTEPDHWLADWLRTCSDGRPGRAAQRGRRPGDQFFECFPPLQARWRPVTESRLAVDLFDGRIRLRGKVDLTIGTADGNAGRQGDHRPEERRGGTRPSRRPAVLRPARDDPHRRATAAAGQLTTSTRAVAHAEAVTVDVLESALARTVDGMTRLVELRNGTGAPGEAPVTIVPLVPDPGPTAQKAGPFLRACSTTRDDVEPSLTDSRRADAQDTTGTSAEPTATHDPPRHGNVPADQNVRPPLRSCPCTLPPVR